MVAYGVPEALNILDDDQMYQIDTLDRLCQEDRFGDDSGTVCTNMVNYVTTVSGGIDSYDMRTFEPYWDIWTGPTSHYFTTSAKV